MSTTDLEHTSGAVRDTRGTSSSVVRTRTATAITDAASRTSQAPPSFTKFGTLTALFVLFRLFLWTLSVADGA